MCRVRVKLNFKPFTMTTTSSLLEQQIAALLRQLKETKEAERLEAVWKEAGATAEKAPVEEEQRRLQAEVEAEAKCVRRVAEQECREREQEEEARQRRLREESTSTLLVAPETELPKSKGKGPELALESEGVRESQRCDSCEKRNAECVCLKVCSNKCEYFAITDQSSKPVVPVAAASARNFGSGALPEVGLRYGRNGSGRRTAVKGPLRGSE